MARPPAVMLRGEALTTCHHLAFANIDPNASHVVLSLDSYGGSARRPASRPRPPMLQLRASAGSNLCREALLRQGHARQLWLTLAP